MNCIDSLSTGAPSERAEQFALRDHRAGRSSRGGAPDRPGGTAALPVMPFGWMESPHLFIPALDIMRNTCRNADIPLSIIKLDLDRFHECNAVHSPMFGDLVLNSLTRHVRFCVRNRDLVGRFRCDRFVIAMPNAVAADAHVLADALRRRLSAGPTTGPSSHYQARISMGIVQSTGDCGESTHELLQRARLALEAAKRCGGNRTVRWSANLGPAGARQSVQSISAPGAAIWVDRLRRSLREARLESTCALVAAVDAKDPYTHAHSVTVAQHAAALGKRMGLPDKLLHAIRGASLLHDVGKIGVPDSILTKAGPLTDDEFRIIQRHPETALSILSHMSHLADERPMILHHHERFDGNGYPARLAGDVIPLGARIIAVADAVDTMLSARSYKPAYDINHVRGELLRGSGGQFDPEVVRAALSCFEADPTPKQLASSS